MARSKSGAEILVRFIDGSSSRASPARTSMLFFNIARRRARSTLRVPEILSPNDWMNAKLAIDCLVLFLYFVIIIAIGLRMGRKERDLEDFALGRRQIPWWAVLASLIAAETSAGTFFGTPGEGYTQRNYTYLQLALGTIIARILVSFIFIKPYYDYKVFSIYEYLTARFGVGTKNAASAIFLFTRLLASGARLYVAAIALALAYEMIRGIRPTQTETLWIYVGATVAIVLLTAIYTTLGGIKAVIWTDLIQASIMIGSALVALGLLYSAIPGGWHSIVEHRGPFHLSDFITTGLDPAKHGWDKWKGMFAIEYTIFAGLIGSTFMTMSTHGTDQDMVQRMLTAPDVRRSRRSLSTALNALATSFTRDWYVTYIRPGANGVDSLRAVRWATVGFSILMIVVASTTSYFVIVRPSVRIIPIVLGIYGYTYGSVLGIFLAGMLTKTRGNDHGNFVAMIAGFIVVTILSGLPNNLAKIFGSQLYSQPEWLPVMEFPWWICFGTIVTFFVAILFRTTREHHPAGV